MNKSIDTREVSADDSGGDMNKPSSPDVVEDPMSPRIKLEILGVLLIGMLLTAVVFVFVEGANKKRVAQEFDKRVNEATQTISTAMIKHSNLVLSLQGLFHSSENLSRADFRRFIRSIGLTIRFPGVIGATWSERVAADEIERFENQVRRDTSVVPEGYPAFQVYPKPEKGYAIVATYVEPIQGNEEALGFDFASVPNRLPAIFNARDTGNISATPPVSQLNKFGETRKSFLMMLPVYSPYDSYALEDRQKNFKGVITVVYRLDDVIDDEFGDEFDFVHIVDNTDDSLVDDDKTIYKHGNHKDLASTLDAVRHVSVGGRRWSLYFQIIAGEERSMDRWIEIAIVFLGGLVSVLAASLFGSLLTSRQNAEAKAMLLTDYLRTANEELSRSNADLSQFAHVASHDLQTPVRNVISAITLLEDHLGESADPEVQEYMGFLLKSAVRMRVLVTDLLDYARLGRDAINFSPIELRDVLARVVDTTSGLCKDTGSRLTVGELPGILGDDRQLERVFENLVTNSIKYAHQDRFPVIEIEQRKRSAVSDKDGYVQILFKDNAQGIDSMFFDTVFLPFKRLHRHDEIAGTGLGLGICKQIVERHGGQISIESSSGEGTTFLITLPVRPILAQEK